MSRLIDADALIEFCAERWIPLNVDAVNMQPTIQPEKAQLSKEGTTKGTPSDTISRQAALEKVRAMQTYKLFMGDDMILIDKAEVQTELMMLPPAQPERKHGKWLADNRPGGGFWVCSCCKFPSEAFAANVLYKFCPNCGADMRGKKDE